MDRKILKVTFGPNQTPAWVCPSCQKGILRIEKGTFKKDELSNSRDHSHEAWEPEWIKYVYSCLLRCSNDDCREIVSNIGTGSVSVFDFEDDQGNWMQETVDRFYPRFFEPHLKLINIPTKCPENIEEPINDAFRLFFASPSAALNSIRTSVEELLNYLKIKRFNIIRNKRKLISLHQRIVQLPTKYDDVREMLMAIKWLGNAGSHEADEISRDDVMDALELMEHVVSNIFSNKSNLAKLAKRVNKGKGPVK